MTEAEAENWHSGRSDWMRLRTLILLRWAAIAGQLAALLVAIQGYGIRLDLPLCLSVVGISIAANLLATLALPQNLRLNEGQAVAVLLFDTAQLALLLALTGGLNNPFSLLIVAPATIGATALRTRATVVLALSTVAMVTLVGLASLPLLMADGTPLESPAIFEFGTWLALVIGVVFLSIYARRVTLETQSMGDALLAAQMALVREQKLTDLGGVVAAAAHELGTPLATIKLVSAELARELADRPELREDAELIRAQALRCRDILHGMGRAGKDDLHLRSAPLEAVVREAAEPHAQRGKTIHISLPADGQTSAVQRRPEIIHGLRNLVQNAVDFAAGNVWIDIEEETVSAPARRAGRPAKAPLETGGQRAGQTTLLAAAPVSGPRFVVRIADDGPGYPPQMIGRIGDPLMRRRAGDTARDTRPGYVGMGLGLFIAKTLLERSGARLSFANGSDPFLSGSERPERSGALVEVAWPRAAIAAPEASGGLGENPLFG